MIKNKQNDVEHHHHHQWKIKISKFKMRINLQNVTSSVGWTAVVHYQGSSHHQQPNLAFTTTSSSFDNDIIDAVTNWSTAIQSGSLAIIALLSLLGNFLVTFSLVRRDQLNFPSNRLAFNLTAANLAYTLLVLPFVIASVVQRKWLFGIFWCNFTAFLTLLNGSASVVTLAMISIDRYYAIVKPMIYNMTITSSKSTAMLLWVWIQACSCSLPPLFGWSKIEFKEAQSTCMVVWWDSSYYTVYLMTFCILIPFGVMTTCYYFIYQVAQKKNRKISIGTVSEVPETDIEANISPGQTQGQAQTQIEKSWKYWKLTNTKSTYQIITKGAWTIIIVIGAFVITWLPFTISALMDSFCGYECSPKWFQVSSTWLMYSASVSYPVVYGVYNRAIRKEMLAWLFHPNVKNAMKGLPSRCGTRGSLLEYSPFRFKNSSRKSNIIIRSRASIDLGILAMTNAAFRKGSQDSGAVMADSDLENVEIGLWSRRRHSASNPVRLQLQNKESTVNINTFKLPILRIISLADGEIQDNQTGDVVIHVQQPEVDEICENEIGFARQTRGESVDEGIVNDCAADES
ncbi:hypothetical protein CHUAL_010556 [Chamberlinius hualienensis]